MNSLSPVIRRILIWNVVVAVITIALWLGMITIEVKMEYGGRLDGVYVLTLLLLSFSFWIGNRKLAGWARSPELGIMLVAVVATLLSLALVLFGAYVGSAYKSYLMNQVI